MNRLNDEFADRIDFFYLDVDVPLTNTIMQTFDVRRRSTYLLLDENGAELMRWAGPITLEALQASMNGALE